MYGGRLMKIRMPI